MLLLGRMNGLWRLTSGEKYCPSARFSARGCLAYVAAALFLCLAGKTSAYSLEGASWPAGSAVVFQLGLGNPGRTLEDGNTSWDAAVAPALDAWNEQVQRIRTASIMNSTVPASSGDRLNTVVFSNSVFGQSFGKSTLAITYYRLIGSNMVEADVIFNNAQSFDSYRGPLQFASNGTVVADIRRVFLHETGHALGLAHPDAAGQKVDAVMNSVVSDRSVLAPDDINGVQFLYGAPLVSVTPTPAPSSTPTPDPGPSPSPSPSPSPTPSASATPTPTPAPTVTGTPGANSVSHLANISTRLHVGLNSDVMIGGFIITGSQPKKTILRGLGPSLGSAGIATALQDPVLELHDSSGAMIARNDDWQTGGQRDEIIATGVAPQNGRESAIVATLTPDSYTVVLQGVGQTTGIAVVEAYELDTTGTRLVNISTRGRVGLDQQVMIGGYIVRGNAQKKVIVRALGPSLNSGSAVQGILADPTLELRNGDGSLIAANDDWMNSPQAAEIIASGLPPSDSRESAVIANLSAGNFTVIVRGAEFTQGVALVEVYDLDR
jgi:hypothetical protein